MSRAKHILILHNNNGPKDIPSERGLGELIRALEGLGARVKLRQCDRRYDEILDEIEHTDTLFFWS